MDAYKNFAYSTVATAPSPASSGTSLVVAAGDGGKFPAVPFNAVIWPAGAQPLTTNAEIVRVTNRATDTLTFARTQESTSARSVVVGDQIMAAWTAKFATDLATQGMQLISDGGVLGADSATLADFTSIPATYNHLLIVMVSRSDQAALGTPWGRFNADSAANYDWQQLNGNNATASTSAGLAQTFAHFGLVAGTAWAAGKAAISEVRIPFYKETTWHKTAVVTSGVNDTTAGNNYVQTTSNIWRSTAAITRVTITLSPGNFKAGSHAILYGLL